MPHPQYDADIAIIGAGPAGSWAARRLALEGVRVLLFDPSHPREKPCGGGVTGRALDLVAPALTEALSGVRITAAQFAASSGDPEATVPLPRDNRALVVVSRSAFDGALLESARRAGAEFIAERVADVGRTDKGFEVRTTADRRFNTPLLAGADGTNSLVRRRFSRAFSREQLSIATGYYAYGATGENVHVAFVDAPPGYIWSFPRPDHLAIGICAQADAGVTPEALRGIVRTWMARTAIMPRQADLRRYSWPIPSLTAHDFSQLEAAGPGWFLLGDAAGLVDPITREGIFFALRSADDAAAAILSGAPRPDLKYTDLLRREIIPELVRASRLKSGFFRPQFIRLLLHALACSPSVARIMADLVAGTQSYAGLKWRLLSTLEWRLAWRLFTMERGSTAGDASISAPGSRRALAP